MFVSRLLLFSLTIFLVCLCLVRLPDGQNWPPTAAECSHNFKKLLKADSKKPAFAGFAEIIMHITGQILTINHINVLYAPRQRDVSIAPVEYDQIPAF
nr:MAG TPA: hypothetical protein [Caudoviricetes sp.]